MTKMKGLVVATALAGMVSSFSPGPALAISSVTVDWNPSAASVVGLNAQAVFTLVDGTHLDVLLKNTSTARPAILSAFSDSANASNQILTGLGFDLPGAITITGGSAVIGTGSASMNFDPNGPAPPVSLGAGADVSVEYGFANGVTFTSNLFPHVGSGDEVLANYVSTMASQTSPFQAVNGTHHNLDGPSVLDGPQGGLVADPVLYPLGGLGAIKNSVLFHLTLGGGSLLNLDSFDTSTVRFEFGSAQIFGTPRPPIQPVPEPTSLLLMGSGLAGVVLWRRKRK